VQTRHLSASVATVAVAVAVLVVAGCASSQAADSATRMRQATQLRTLERPTVRGAKLTFISLTRHRDARAAEELERASESAGAVLEWLDHHSSFVRANRPSTECLEESLGELRERTEELVTELRARELKADERAELKRGLAEAVNCIQASD
jgi:hypothetical protein